MEENILEPSAKKFKLWYFVIPIIILAVGAGIFFMTRKPSFNSDNSQVSAVEKTITLDEVAKHADVSSCWMVISGKVYDVTSYIPGHPGGDQILLGCGKDATTMFNSRPSDGTSHSGRARNLLTQFEIGTLAQ